MKKSGLRSSPFLLLWLLAAATIVLITAARAIELRLSASEQQQVADTLLNEILANVPHDNDLASDSFELAPDSSMFVQQQLLGLDSPRTAYIARQQNRLTALVLPATTLEGYNGPIELLAGITADGVLTGVRVVSHNETPGLGARIELAASDWLLSFNNRSLENTDPLLWRVKKDGGEFDQFAGATITPRAVVAAVHDVLEFFAANRTVLLSMNSASVPAAETHLRMIGSTGITSWLTAIMQPLPLLLLALVLALRNVSARKEVPPPPPFDPDVAGSKRVRVTGKP